MRTNPPFSTTSHTSMDTIVPGTTGTYNSSNPIKCHSNDVVVRHAA